MPAQVLHGPEGAAAKSKAGQQDRAPAGVKAGQEVRKGLLLWFVAVVAVAAVVVFHEYCGYIEEILDAFSSQAPMFGIKSKFP